MTKTVAAPSGVRERVVDAHGLRLSVVTEQLVSSVASVGRHAVTSGTNRFRIARTYRPVWASVVGLALSPFLGLGLLFLLVKRTETSDAAVFEDRVGVKVRFTGAVPDEVVLAVERGIASVAAERRAADGVGTTSTTWAPAERHPESPAPRPPAPAAPAAPRASPPPPAAPFAPPSAAVASLSGSSVPAPSGPRLDPDTTISAAQLAALRAQQTFRLDLTDGTSIVPGAGVVVGREVATDQRLPGAASFVISHPTVSVRHASVSASSAGVRVLDHGSEHGTTVAIAERSSLITPGQWVEVPVGGRIAFGQVWMTVTRSGG